MNIKTIIEEITGVTVLAGNKSLVRKSFNPKKKEKEKTVNKKWYDKDCRSLLKELDSMKNCFNRNVSDNDLRIRYYKTFWEYK